jgi:hypothetical protein
VSPLLHHHPSFPNTVPPFNSNNTSPGVPLNKDISWNDFQSHVFYIQIYRDVLFPEVAEEKQFTPASR